MSWVAGQRVRLARDHRAPARAALRVRMGELVRLGRNDDTWPAFVWTESADGVGGWVPERYFRRTSDGLAAEAVRGYDTTELTAVAGTLVELVELDDESGWIWCRTEDGTTGWVPAAALVPADPGP